MQNPFTDIVSPQLRKALYLAAFYDAGNVWRHAREFDPTRLFRGHAGSKAADKKAKRK